MWMLSSRNCFYHLYVQFQIYQDSDLCWLLGIATIERAIILIHSKHTGRKEWNRKKRERLNHKNKKSWSMKWGMMNFLLCPDCSFHRAKVEASRSWNNHPIFPPFLLHWLELPSLYLPQSLVKGTDLGNRTSHFLYTGVLSAGWASPVPFSGFMPMDLHWNVGIVLS